MMEAGWSAKPTASSITIQAQVVPSLGAPVSSRTIRRCQAEEHLGSRRPIRVLPLTPIDALFWSGAAHEEPELQQDGTNVVFSGTSKFNISSDDNRVRVWRPRGERLNPAFALQWHITPTAGAMVWGVIASKKRPPLVLIRGTMTAQRYVHDILQPHVLPLLQRLPGAIFQQDNARSHTARVSQDSLRTVTTLTLTSPIPKFVSNRAYLGSFETVNWESHEFERTRGKVTANMLLNISRHHAELVCLNSRSYRIVHSR
ncbi:transposable element Tcb1 transposase [Trichonephila clavipes]|nr:transposable element Tcb1 transposase [Trichonephila clavipes]